MCENIEGFGSHLQGPRFSCETFVFKTVFGGLEGFSSLRFMVCPSSFELMRLDLAWN